MVAKNSILIVMRSPLSYLPLAAGMLVLVLSLALGVLTVTSKNNLSQNLSTKATMEVASFSLSPLTGTYNFVSGTSYPVGILVDSAGKSIDGVDIILNFDPKKVQVVGTTVATTSIFEQYLTNSVDNVNGVIKLSGLTFNTKPITGIVGTFRFQPLIKGEVTFNFQFTPGATTDSNVADHTTGKDILGNVQNGAYSFQ